jgi:PAS domain S-box-containing protein
MIDPDEIGRALLAGASDAVVASDREGRIIFWNPGAERIFGFSAAEAVGQSLDIIIPEPYRARHWAGYDETIRTGTSRYGAGDILAVPGLRKDGTRNSIEFTIAVVKDANGNVAAMAAVIRDVTKKFEETKALKIQIAELKRKSAP